MFLAIREMRFAKGRYSLIAVIMVLVAFLALFVTGLAQGLAYDNAASIKNRDATHFVLEKDANHRFTRSSLGVDQLLQAGEIVGEQNAEPFGVSMTTVLSGSSKIDAALLAVRPDGWMSPVLTEGEPLSAANQVLVDQELASLGIRIGDVLEDQATGAQWTVSGFVRHESFSHAPAIFLSMQDWAALRAKTSAREGVAAESFNAIAVKASKEQAATLQSKLTQVEVITKSDAIAAIPGYKEEQGSLMMMIAFLFVISAFVLAVFFYVMTIQKSSQFGVLKAIGTRTSYLAKNTAAQVFLLSVGSLAVSVVLIEVVKAILPDSMPFQLDFTTLAVTCLAFIAMSLAGSLLSVRQISKVDALDAIGRTAV